MNVSLFCVLLAVTTSVSGSDTVSNLPRSIAGLVPASAGSTSLSSSANAPSASGVVSAVGVQGGESDPALTPDYVEGPWLPLPDEHLFDADTDRPLLKAAIEKLHQVSRNFQEIANITDASRNAEKAREDNMRRAGEETIARLQKQLDHLEAQRIAFEKIHPTILALGEASKTLSQTHHQLSRLYQADAEARFPLAERVADFSKDLQDAIRARETGLCQLRTSVPKATLHALDAQYNRTIAGFRDKVLAETRSAGVVLDPLRTQLERHTRMANQSLAQHGSLRKTLHGAVASGSGYLPQATRVKQQLAYEEGHFVEGVATASKIQDDVIAETRVIFEKQIGVWHHITSLLAAMSTPSDQPVADQTAFEIPVAQQRPAAGKWDALHAKYGTGGRRGERT